MARKLIVEIIGDTSSLEKSFKKTQAASKNFDRSLSQTARGAVAGSGAFRSLGRQVAFASSAFLGGAGLVAVLKSTVTASSRLQEETEKTGVVFGKSAKGVQDWAGTLALSFGVSKGAALEAAGVFGNMFHSLHIGESDAATMSKRLVQLAADMASFNNASPEDTLAALQSGLAGQVRPLRQFGVFLSQDRIKAEALSDGIAKNASHLTATQKLQAAYNIILKDTKLQVGDVARNTESLSVAQSKLQAEIENSQAIIGNALRPELAKLANSLADWIDKQQKTGKLQRDVNETVKVAKQVFEALQEVLVPLAAALKNVSENLGGVKTTLKIVAGIFVGMKVLSWANSFRKLAGSLNAVAAANRNVAASNAFGVPGGQIGPPTKPFVSPIPGGVVGAATAGAILAFGQRGETSTKPSGSLKVSVGPGGLIAYRDPVTGKFVLARGFTGGDPQAFVLKDIKRRHPGVVLPGGSAGTSPIGENALGNRPVTPESGATAGRHRLGSGLHAQFLRSQLALAKAQTTATDKDDRIVLAQQDKIIRAAIAQTTNLKKRTKLYQQLASIDDQIRSIDAKAAADKKTAHDKELAARAKELAADKASYAKIKAQADKLLAQFKKRREALKAASDAVRTQIGDIFTGPVFKSPEGVLGIQNARAVAAPVTAAGFVANLRAQTSQFVKLNNDLARLARSGAPAALIKQLREGGAEQAPLIHQLATAGRPTLRSLFRAFAQQEKVVQQIAHADVQAKTVTIVTSSLNARATTPSTQRRGRQAGVPSTIGSYINP